MPVKLRCPKCETVLTLPDASRGKQVRCKSCQTVIRVPAGKSKPAAGKKPPDSEPDMHSSTLFTNLNLDDVEDTSVRICPNCGADIAEDAEECPYCFTDPTTGQLSARERRKRERGVDPTAFHRYVWKDGWRFVKAHRAIVVRSIIYLSIFLAIFLGCMYMITWCVNPPPRMIWAFFGFLTMMVSPGWIWFLHVEVVRATLENKDKLPRTHFDQYQCAALGIKTVVWWTLFGLPFWLIAAALLIHFNLAVVAITVAAVGICVVLFLTPVAMAHMAMPISYPAWLVNMIAPIAWRHRLAILHGLALVFVSLIPSIALLVTDVVVYRTDFEKLIAELKYNSAIAAAQAAPDTLPEGTTDEQRAVWEKQKALAEKEPTQPDMTRFIVPAVLLELAVIWFCVGSLWGMRANGLFARVFKRELDLISERKETKFVSRADRKRMREEKKLKRKQEKEAKRRAKQQPEEEEDDL